MLFIENKLTVYYMFICIFVILLFLMGLYFYTTYSMPQSNCPDMLLQKDGKLTLFHSKSPSESITFNNLEEYVKYVKMQRDAGINCPVLYLQNSYDTQGRKVYKIRPSPTDPQGGLPPTANADLSILKDPKNPNNNTKTLLVDSNHSDPPYNYNSMPGFDPSSFYVGKETPLDTFPKLLHSPDPMDDNWGGLEFTQKLIDSGYYKDNEVLR